MATTFSASFKNLTIDSITGRASTTQILRYLQFYNGAQPALPSDTPAGSPVFSAYSASVDVSTYMTQPALGISALNGSRSASATSAVSSITFSRIFGSSGTAMIDAVASLSGGGGGVIVPTLTSSAGVAYQVDSFSIKLPQTNSTLMLNAALVNALVSAWTVTAANVAAGASASIKIYSGSAPASADAAATGTLLATFTTAAGGTSWNAASAGSAALASNLAVAASATGTAGYARMEKGTFVLQGSVGTAATDFIIDSTSLVNGNTVTLTNATITL